jgi:hypothetical protein
VTDLERAKWPDPVLRVKDAMDLHAVTHIPGDPLHYAVFSMQDGRPITMDLYPSRARGRIAAEKLTTDLLLILQISPDGMPYREADAVLRYERQLNNMGVQSPDVLETEENSGILSMPRNRHDRRRMAKQLITGRPLYHESVSYGNLPNLENLKRGLN